MAASPNSVAQAMHQGDTIEPESDGDSVSPDLKRMGRRASHASSASLCSDDVPIEIDGRVEIDARSDVSSVSGVSRLSALSGLSKEKTDKKEKKDKKDKKDKKEKKKDKKEKKAKKEKARVDEEETDQFSMRRKALQKELETARAGKAAAIEAEDFDKAFEMKNQEIALQQQLQELDQEEQHALALLEESKAEVSEELSKRWAARRESQKDASQTGCDFDQYIEKMLAEKSQGQPKVESELEKRLAAQTEKQQRIVGAVESLNPDGLLINTESKAGIYAERLNKMSPSTPAHSEAEVECELSKRLAAVRDRVQQGTAETSVPADVQKDAVSSGATFLYTKPLKKVPRSSSVPSVKPDLDANKAEAESELSKRLAAQREKQRTGHTRSTSVPQGKSGGSCITSPSELQKRLSAVRDNLGNIQKTPQEGGSHERSPSQGMQAESELVKRLAAVRDNLQKGSNVGGPQERSSNMPIKTPSELEKQLAAAKEKLSCAAASVGSEQSDERTLKEQEEKISIGGTLKQADGFTQPEAEPPCASSPLIRSKFYAREGIAGSLPDVRQLSPSQSDASNSAASELSKRLAAQRSKQFVGGLFAADSAQSSKSKEAGANQIVEQLGKLRSASASAKSHSSSEKIHSELSKRLAAQAGSSARSLPSVSLSTSPQVDVTNRAESELSKRLSEQQSKKFDNFFAVEVAKSPKSKGDEENKIAEQRSKLRSASRNTKSHSSSESAGSELSKRLAAQQMWSSTSVAKVVDREDSAKSEDLAKRMAVQREQQQRGAKAASNMFAKVFREGKPEGISRTNSVGSQLSEAAKNTKEGNSDEIPEECSPLIMPNAAATKELKLLNQLATTPASTAARGQSKDTEACSGREQELTVILTSKSFEQSNDINTLCNMMAKETPSRVGGVIERKIDQELLIKDLGLAAALPSKFDNYLGVGPELPKEDTQPGIKSLDAEAEDDDFSEDEPLKRTKFQVSSSCGSCCQFM